MTAASTRSTLIFPRPDGSPRRVLYAEDQVTSRVVTKAMLERMGFQVDAVEDGELALHFARNDNYDVILLDIEMPVMDGVTAARTIRAELEHTADTPILALSAFLADSTEHCQWRDAFDSALPKPANGNELFKALHSAVQIKDARAQRMLPAKPSKEDLVRALKHNLPSGVWKRISVAAADEMFHLINVLAATCDASDQAALQLVSRKLVQIASSFGAIAVAELTLSGDISALRRAVNSWVSA
jgi:CheY-like chemotaxis protein